MIEKWISPLSLSLTAALEGFLSPDPEKEFNYAFFFFEDETFFISLASVYPHGNFFGIDPDEFFLKKAEEIKKEVSIENISFLKDLSDDLPEFDYIVINRAYSYKSEEEREKIIEFSKRKLKENGILCICYETLPGKISYIPFWEFLQRLFPKERYTDEERGKKAFNFLRIFSRRGSFYLRSNPDILREVQYYLSNRKSKEELQEEFKRKLFSSYFKPEFFYEIFERMKTHGFNYIGSAEAYLNELEFSVPPSQIPTFFEVSRTELSETLKDFIRNTKERADLYTKSEAYGIEKTIPIWCKKLKIFNVYPLSYISKVIDLPGGAKLPIKDEIFDRIYKNLSEGKVAVDLSEILEFPEKKIRKSILRLLLTHEFNLAYNDTEIKEPDEKEFKLSKLNSLLLKKSIDLFSHFSPISQKCRGVGLTLSPSEALLLDTYLENREDAKKLFSEKIKKYMDLSKIEIDNLFKIFQEKTIYGLIKTGII